MMSMQTVVAITFATCLLVALSQVAMFWVCRQSRNELRLLRRELYRISGYLLRREEEQRQPVRESVPPEHQRL